MMLMKFAGSVGNFSVTDAKQENRAQRLTKGVYFLYTN